RALTMLGPKLWEKYDNGDNLLLRARDLAEPEKSPLLKEFWSLPDETLHDLVVYLVNGLKGPLEQAPLLSELVQDAFTGHPTPAMEKATAQVLGHDATFTRPVRVAEPRRQTRTPQPRTTEISGLKFDP